MRAIAEKFNTLSIVVGVTQLVFAWTVEAIAMRL